MSQSPFKQYSEVKSALERAESEGFPVEKLYADMVYLKGVEHPFSNPIEIHCYLNGFHKGALKVKLKENKKREQARKAAKKNANKR